MSVYVDPAIHRFRRMIMCHLWADTRYELFEMVDRIGVQRKWFQRPRHVDLPGMNASWEHFDIAKSKRKLAIACGAIETDRYGPVEHTARLAGNHDKIRVIAEIRARRAPGSAPTIHF